MTLLGRALYFIAGVDRDIIASCPDGDRTTAKLVAISLLLVWCLHFVVATTALTIPFATDGGAGLNAADYALCGIGGALAASLVVAFDISIIKAMWFRDGERQLAKRARKLGTLGGPTEAMRFYCTLLARLAISVTAAVFFAKLFSFVVYSADLRVEAEMLRAEKNAAIRQEHEEEIDGRLRAYDRRLKEADTQLEGLIQEEARLNDPSSTLVSTASDPEIEQIRGRSVRVGQPEIKGTLAQLEEARQAAIARRNAADNLKACELNGNVDTRKCPTATGKPGDGPAYKQAVAEWQQATDQVNDVERQIVQQRARLQALEAKADAERAQSSEEKKRKVAAYENARRSIIERREKANVEKAAALDEQQKLINDRPRELETLLAADSRYERNSYGFLVRARALGSLERKDPGVWLFSTLLGLVFMALELLAIVGKMANHIPTTYAKLLYARDYKVTSEVIYEVVNHWRRMTEPPAPTNDTDRPLAAD